MKPCPECYGTTRVIVYQGTRRVGVYCADCCHVWRKVKTAARVTQNKEAQP